MFLPASRFTELNTWRGPTRSSSSTGGTTTTMIRRTEGARGTPEFLLVAGISLANYRAKVKPCASLNIGMADFDGLVSQIASSASLAFPPPIGTRSKLASPGGKRMKHRWIGMVGAAVLVGAAFPTLLNSQTTNNGQAPGLYARIAIMRALDERHTVDWEAGYVRHLEWHRQAKDPFAWYSYSVWASTEKQRWIIYATFGHTAAELSNPVSPAEDERDTSINVLPHVQFMGNGIYEFLPALSRGSGVPSASARAQYTTIELK